MLQNRKEMPFWPLVVIAKKQLQYSHLPPISQTNQVRWVKHAECCWRSKDKFISKVLLWTPTHGHTSKNFHNLSKFLRWSLIIAITYNIQTIDLIIIVILITFRMICPSASFRCFMLNLRVHTESQTEPFIWTTEEERSNSVHHDWVKIIKL